MTNWTWKYWVLICLVKFNPNQSLLLSKPKACKVKTLVAWFFIDLKSQYIHRNHLCHMSKGVFFGSWHYSCQWFTMPTFFPWRLGSKSTFLFYWRCQTETYNLASSFPVANMFLCICVSCLRVFKKKWDLISSNNLYITLSKANNISVRHLFYVCTRRLM